MGTKAKFWPTDATGRQLKVGQTVVRATNMSGGYSPELEMKQVTAITEGKSRWTEGVAWNVYLDGSKVPMMYPSRLAIVKDVE